LRSLDVIDYVKPDGLFARRIATIGVASDSNGHALHSDRTCRAVDARLNPCMPEVPRRALRRCGRHTALARALLTILALLLGLQAAIPASAREWHFDVSVDGLPIATSPS